MATNRKITENETFLLCQFPWDQQRAITLMNLVPANQFGSHFLNHKNPNWKHMHQTKWHKLQNILCQKYDKNSRLFSFQRNMIKSWKPMAPHCWAVFMSQVWQSPKMDSWNFSRSVHITRIWIFTMLEECLHYKMNIYVRNRLCFVLCDKKTHWDNRGIVNSKFQLYVASIDCRGRSDLWNDVYFPKM